MGVLFLSVFLWVYFSIFLTPSVPLVISNEGGGGGGDGGTICYVQGCNCTRKAATWRTVNCTLNNKQEVEFGPNSIPSEITEIFINGGKQIGFATKSFNMLPAMGILSIDNTEEIVMEKQSFFNLTSPSLLIKIQNCDRLIIKAGAIDIMHSSIDTEIIRCGYVSLGQSAFSKLNIGQYKDIRELVLTTETFEFKNQKYSNRHGVITKISFDNVNIPKIPHRTFFSALGELNIDNSKINVIYNEAFWSYEIYSITISNSTINYMKNGALTNHTLIFNLKIIKSNISKLESRSVMAGINNLFVQHSRITDIIEGAINSTVANVDITGNEIANFHQSAFVFHNWNSIVIHQNIIKNLHSNFLIAPVSPDVATIKVAFTGNDVYNLDAGALNFVSELDDQIFYFENNFFNQTCHCLIDEWILELISVNSSKRINQIKNNTFCTINDLLSTCFELPKGLINIQNFTELVCNSNNTIFCEPYNGETKIVNTTSEIFDDDNKSSVNTSWITLIITCTSLLIISICVTSIVLLIRGGRWLKRKGYFLKIHYSQNEQINDDEHTTVTEDESDKFDGPKELTEELLQNLRDQLNDPNTTQEASEMIERLYEMFIVDDNYDNNNRQDEEEAHLYEELGNLQNVPQTSDDNKTKAVNGPRIVQQLKEIEEKYYPQLECNASGSSGTRPALLDYSEPSDVAEHLYSELKQNRIENGNNNNSLKSTASTTSGIMAFRPLPHKPENNLASQPGPSSSKL